MNTINVNVLPTPDLNVTLLTINFADFDPHRGIHFTCTFFNSSNMIIDRRNVPMVGEDWQEWPSYETSEEDYNYVKQFCLDYLKLTEST